MIAMFCVVKIIEQCADVVDFSDNVVEKQVSNRLLQKLNTCSILGVTEHTVKTVPIDEMVKQQLMLQRMTGIYAEVDYRKDYAILSKVTFSENLTDVQYVVPYGVLHIATDCFSKCSELISVTLPDTCMRIGSRAFVGCEKLQWVRTRNVHDIDSFAFFKCYSLKAFGADETQDGLCVSVTDNRVVSVGQKAFSYCPLQRLCFDAANVNLDDLAFCNCDSLQEVTFLVEDVYLGLGYGVFDGTNMDSLVLPRRTSALRDAVTGVNTKQASHLFGTFSVRVATLPLDVLRRACSEDKAIRTLVPTVNAKNIPLEELNFFDDDSECDIRSMEDYYDYAYKSCVKVIRVPERVFDIFDKLFSPNSVLVEVLH